MNTKLLLLISLLVPVFQTPAQTNTVTPPAVVTPRIILPTRTLRLAPGQTQAVSTATSAKPTTVKEPKASATPETNLVTAIQSMKLERSPEALVEFVKNRPAGAEMSDPDKFRFAVLLGDWNQVGQILAALPETDGMTVYTRLLEALASNAQSADQFFQQTNPRNMPNFEPDPESQPQGNRPPKRALFLSEDFYALAEAAPADLTSANVAPLATLAKIAIGQGGRAEFVARLKTGLKGLGGTTASGKKMGALLLSAMGWTKDSGPFLPLARDEWDKADTLTLVLTLEYFTQLGIENRDEREFKRAAEVCALMMQTSRFNTNEAGIFRQATERFVKMLPELQPEEAEQLIRESFLSHPEILVDLMLTLGESGQKIQRGEIAQRSQALETQNLLFRVLAGRKAAPPEAVNLLVMNWLTEAEQTYKYGSTANAVAADIDNPYLIYRPYMMNQRQTIKTIPAEVILTNAPPSNLVKRLNRSLAQRVNLTLLKVTLLEPKEPMTIETLKEYLANHPGQEKQLCQDYLSAWVKKRTVAAEDPNLVRMRNLGYNIPRQQAAGIPLTRLRQNQNVAEFKSLLGSLRAMAGEPLDSTAVIQSFMAIHSGAEVYRLDDIETIFGPPEKMSRDELMGLVTGMRTKLREQWRDPVVQQEAGSNRTEPEVKDEVSQGYRTAIELVRRGLKPEEAQWKEFIVRGQLFFDAAEYEFSRQVKLVEYINLRDEAFSSYEKAAGIYAAKIPDAPRAQWTMEPYQMWFFVMLGASDLSQLTRAAARSDPGLTKIGQAMRALPPEAAEGHLELFGKMLGQLVPQVPANMRQRFLSAGLQVIGADHPSAKPAQDILKSYQELLDEIQLLLTIDGPTRVGHSAPFGAFLSLEHTRQVGRESGGFAKYLQNPAAQSRAGMPMFGNQRSVNYRDDFAKNIHAALDETFEVVSITFQEPNVPSLDLERAGWQETPLAYLVLRAKDAAVDRIPSIQLDMDFADQSGQVVLPVRSQVQPIDAKNLEPVARPCEDLALTFTMDEREWRSGKVVVEVAARANGVIPDHKQLFAYEQEGFDVEVTDNGLSIGQYVVENKLRKARADRNWQFNYRRTKDVRGDVVFKFPALKEGIKAQTVEYKHYQDADLAVLEPAKALQGVTLSGSMSRSLQYGFLAGLVILAGAGFYLLRRYRKTHAPTTTPGLVLPSEITPFSVVAFLRRLERDYRSRLDVSARAALGEQIRQIEAAYFQPGQPSSSAPALEPIARKWLNTVT